jgi:PAS domain S-box-containing protein
MQRIDPGLDAGRTPGTGGPEPHRGLLTCGAADQLAALAARAAQAPSGLICFVEGDRLRIYGGWGPLIRWEDAAATPVEDTIAHLIMTTGEPVVIGDFRTDPRIPAGSPIRRRGLDGAYLGHPVRDRRGTILGVCCALDQRPRHWEPGQIAAVAEAAEVGTLLFTEQLARHEADRQHRFLDAVVDSLHEGITACDADGNIVLVNARMRRFWGDGEVPLTVDDDAMVDGLFTLEGKPYTRRHVGLFRALRGEHLRDEEVILRGRERRTRYYLVDAQPIIGPDGTTAGAVQAVADITRRRRAERFRSCELDVSRSLAGATSVSGAGQRVLEAVVSALDWVHAELWLVDDAAGLLHSVARWSTPGWAGTIAVPADMPFGQGLAGRAWQVGKPLWIRDVAQPQSLISAETAASSKLRTALAIPVRHGLEPLGVLTLFADSVEDPEDEIVALLAGIAAHIGQFVERLLVEDLQRQLARSKNEYLALIGHELRTPLTSISAYTELLRELEPEALAIDGPAMLEVVERNTAQLRHIINELLELSALDTGHAPVHLTPVDLAGLVRESVECTLEAIDGSPLVLAADLPEELVLPGDRRRLRQIIDNLLGNAVKYSPDGGRISVSLRPVAGAAELNVSDTGIGISPEDREKLFTRLYRSSRVRDKAIPGIGLGLALSRAVVQRHHGTIELIDHEGPGTTIKVRLPLDAR